MKKVKCLSLCLLFAATVFTACSKDDTTEDQAIKVSDKGSLTQSVYADDEQGKSGVAFTTAGAWTSNITETASTKSTPAWISVTPDHGDKAGDYTISISLSPNYTGADRAATIHIVCGDTEITISVTQKYVNEDGKTPIDPITLDELRMLIGQRFEWIQEQWLQIDNKYSTDQSRQSVTPASPFLYDFWNKSYECIYYSNLFLGRISGSDVPDKEVIEYRVRAIRSIVYYYLKTLFGRVPVTLNPTTPANSLPRENVQAIVDFIYNDFNLNRPEDILSNLFYSDIVCVDYIREIICVQEADLANANRLLGSLIDESVSFRDINADGLINDQDDNTIACFIYLLQAETYLKTENMQKAIECINIIYTAYGRASRLSATATSDDIQSALRSEHQLLTGTGMKFMNAVRWGDTQSWEYRALLPVPLQAMQENPNLTQNPGW
jgi:hypothetical protein